MISVVVPFHNLDYLFECVSSLENQTYDDTEIILIDDSQDGEVGYTVLSFISGKNRIRYHVLNEKGYEAGARQKGLELAKGEIVLQTDSDAVYPPEFIKLMALTLAETGAMGVEQGYIVTIPDDNLAYFHAKYKREASYRLKLAGKKEPYGGTMYRTEARNHVHYKPLKQGTDTEFVADLKAQDFRFAFCKEAYFFHHDPSTLLQLYERSAAYYAFIPKNGFFYFCKRLFASLFPLCGVFLGERLTQYELALKARDIRGVLGIFLGNYLIDLSSWEYIVRLW